MKKKMKNKKKMSYCIPIIWKQLSKGDSGHPLISFQGEYDHPFIFVEGILITMSF